MVPEPMLFATDIASEMAETQAQIAYFSEHLMALRRSDGAPAPTWPRSAYCIGATYGLGARHEQCPGSYHGRRCGCACHRSYLP